MVHPTKNPSDAAGALGQAVEQHRQLHGHLDELSAVMLAPDALAILEFLQGFLAEHFLEEVAPEGLYETILDRAPRFERQTRALLAEHVEVEQRIRALTEKLRGIDAAIVDEIADEIGDLIAVLRQHELTENRLLGEALYTEHGGGD